MACGSPLGDFPGPLRILAWCLLASSPLVQTAPTGGESATLGISLVSTTRLGTGLPSGSAACAQVASITSSLLSASPSATPSVPASVAYACLQSVPNKPVPALNLIKSLRAYAQWQSTLVWLKNPPESYKIPGVDVLGRFDKIEANVKASKYASEYDFQRDIYMIYTAAHDGHFSFRGDVFRPFRFQNELGAGLVSISTDGKALPKLYHQADLAQSNPQAIVKINGQDAAQHIETKNLQYSFYHDPDSQWNSVLRNYLQANVSIPTAASFDYQGDSLTLEYEDGTTQTSVSYAIVGNGYDFSRIQTGEDFYTYFCTPASRSTDMASLEEDTSEEADDGEAGTPPLGLQAIEGFPTPAVRDSGANITAGYFLEGEGYEDVAVLSVLEFAPSGEEIQAYDYLKDFQDTVARFLAMSKAMGKKKLVIDFVGNGGGYVMAGLELYAQLFPGQRMYQASNMRATDSLLRLARAATNIVTSPNLTVEDFLTNPNLAYLAVSPVIRGFIPGSVATPNGITYTSLDQILAPVTLEGDSFTSYQRIIYDEPNAAFNLTGVGSRANAGPPVFEEENITILTDGTCASTCTLFSYLMVFQNKVKTVAVGGRPRTGGIQAIAGVEGSQLFPLKEIRGAARATLNISPELASRSANDSSDILTLAEGYAIRRAAQVAAPGGVNGKNSFSMADAGTPMQFLYEPANCRLFYTKDMIQYPVAVWKKTVDAIADPEGVCVEGSVVANVELAAVDPGFDSVSPADNIASDEAKNTGATLRSRWMWAVIGAVSWQLLLA